MRIKSLMLRLLAAAAFVASVSVSCSEVSFIEINPPADLQEKIDSIQAVKDAANAAMGDKTPIEITVPVVGAEDCSSAHWTTWSEYFKIPTGKLFHLEFVNHGTGVGNYNNWNLVVTNPKERGADGYSEYFFLRADVYGWGNDDWNRDLITMELAGWTENPGWIDDEDGWARFREVMQGAYVKMDVDHSSTGYVFVTVEATGVEGDVINYTYNHPVSTTEDIWAFLSCDGSWFELKQAWLEPSKVQAIPDEVATSISVTGTPSAIEVGSDDFWGKGVATVTYADGSNAQVDTADVNFVVPDLTTVGAKTILYSYSKTKQGNYGPSVAGYYTLQVVNPVVKLEVTKAPSYAKYYVYDAPVAFNPAGIEVTATYADGTSSVIDNAMLTFGTVPADGTQKVEVSYVGNTSTVKVDCPVEVVKGTGAVGLADCSTPWWVHFSDNYVLAAGESKTLKMMLYSKALENYHSPSIALRSNVLTENAEGNLVYPEYAVVRMDHFGWGTGFNISDAEWIATGESNWNWDTFKPNLNMSLIEITIMNNGDDKADVLYSVTYLNGEEHFQNYKGIVVNSADLHAALVLEQSYVVFFD